jgi:hypothetical protein
VVVLTDWNRLRPLLVQARGPQGPAPRQPISNVSGEEAAPGSTKGESGPGHVADEDQGHEERAGEDAGVSTQVTAWAPSAERPAAANAGAHQQTRLGPFRESGIQQQPATSAKPRTAQPAAGPNEYGGRPSTASPTPL